MSARLLIFAALALTACGGENAYSNSTNSSTTEPVLTASDSLTLRLDSLQSTQMFNGFSVAVVGENGVKYSQGFGYADTENQKPYTSKTTTNVASISKMFIGVSLVIAQEQGLLSLDDPIAKYLPFEVQHPKHSDTPITIRQLATHTSSILDGDKYMEHDYVRIDNLPLDTSLVERYGLYYKNPPEEWVPLADFLSALLSPQGKWYDEVHYAEWKPGGEFDYSNTGAALCALVIESAAKQSFESFTEEYIFKPLGMNSTAWSHERADMSMHTKLYSDSLELPKYSILSYPDGGLITSVEDFSLFLIEFIKGYEGRGTLVQPDNYKDLYEPQLTKAQLGSKTGFNAGLFNEMHLPYNVIGHNGGDPGVNTMLFYDTEKKTGRILLTNTDSRKEQHDTVYWAIWDALGEFK